MEKLVVEVYNNIKKFGDTSKLSVIIINAPCMGFGDIVFGIKFATILRKWYKCNVKIITTQKDNFILLGEDPNNVYGLTSKSENSQCRRLKNMILEREVTADIYFVAPLQQDFEPDMNDVRMLFPNVNKLNTFFVSEYNDSLHKKIMFHTGIGGKRYGLLLTEPEINPPPLKIGNIPYCVIYVANSLDRVKSCVYKFITMVAKKYSGNDFQIVLSSWILNFNMLPSICNILRDYFGEAVLCYDGKCRKNVLGKRKNKVYIRLDVLPLPNNEMINLMSGSVRDILVTGDQSITDVLSCCIDKNIFYQIAPWKKSFAKNLVKELPNKWLSKKSESCGGLKAIKYKSDYSQFRERWNFSDLARPMMDMIFSINTKTSSEAYNVALVSRNVNSFKNKMEK